MANYVPKRTSEISEDDIAYLHQLLFKGIRNLGIKSLTEHLKSLVTGSTYTPEQYDHLVEYILTQVVDEWKAHKVTKRDLFEISKRGEVTMARKMAVILIHQNIKISDAQLAEFFGRKSRQVVYNIIREFEGMTENPKIYGKFLAKHHSISHKIKQYVSSIKQENANGRAE